MSTGSNVKTFDPGDFFMQKITRPCSCDGAVVQGPGIVISMVFYGSHIILLSAAALQHYGH